LKAPDELIRDLMARVRRDFYQGKPDKAWFAQQQLVKKALLYPARWLKEKAVEIPAERYEAIVVDILATARRSWGHGQDHVHEPLPVATRSYSRLRLSTFLLTLMRNRPHGAKARHNNRASC
jgi:hypothetical protein